ncbi:TetR/AcrR family transcriptional regulator [Nocardiopsis alba]|uniref:TetR/AcrR family transcriptional regulator n=1 Tax=Nocardiopsis alba TaxID=53437 RepID=UPI0033B58D38
MEAERSRGQHAGLDARTIRRAAIRLVDREGLSALSMRGLGAELGVKAMALYHHFPNKEALLDGMVEEIVTATPVAVEGGDWQEGLGEYARTRLGDLMEHPNLVPLLLSRPGDTEGNHRMMEELLRLLGAAGFPPVRALDMVYALNALVLVHAALAVDAGGASTPVGEAGQNARLMALPPRTYPLLNRAAHEAADRGPTARFEFALEALLSGFAEARER